MNQAGRLAAAGCVDVPHVPGVRKELPRGHVTPEFLAPSSEAAAAVIVD